MDVYVVTVVQVGNLTIRYQVKVSQVSCAGYGLVAINDISTGDILFETPGSLILTPQTSSIGQLLDQEADVLKTSSGWTPLLLTLLHEYTTPQSKWTPYFQIVEEFNQPNLPMFWNREIVEEELKGTDVIDAVDRDVERITEEFQCVALPFIKSHPNIFPSQCHDIELYKRMAGLVMAYSFTEPVYDDDDSDEDESFVAEIKSQPMIVPMADILNHVAKNNAHLDFGKDTLKMIATKEIKAGEEIFNTYGELANSQLLHMYGFAEAYPNNHYDRVDISMRTVYDVVEKETTNNDEKGLLGRKWKYLQDTGVVADDGVFVLGSEGFLTDEEVYQTLKVLSLEQSAFNLHEKEADDDWCESLNNEDVQHLPEPWRNILKWTCTARLAEYSTTLETEIRTQTDSWQTLTRQQRFSSHVRYGQLQLLHGLLDRCQHGS